MQLAAARIMAVTLMRQHGLHGWSLVFDNAKTRAGVCRPSRRQIGLSRALTALHSDAEVRDTILHEIAHALVGAEHGHDAVWRATARRIGCTARRCVPESAARPPAPWTGRCPAGHETSRYRVPTRVVACGVCSHSFDRSHLIDWRYHGRAVPMPPGYVASLARLGDNDRDSDGHTNGTGDNMAVSSLPTAAKRVLAPALAVGSRVRLGGTGRYAGMVGTIEKRGRTRYHVRIAVGLVTAPFALVRKA